ncbi:bifunctional 4-hydroxy-2-oxoglutarate aldolase/2-dehydro-3-deoxy-phosphogluconate aldolase [Aliiglaciecola sp. LCG003]|uniref:bifunctional 4-hydroxy-2-oxoglutarate aldolase/2-dehydro-3-deoxy-phosphogluconate aldolase n=1 Tax=Aliiglaciecola sp. LCG003 TaxID=3053655 RepID=UPI00257337A3|nr:bifunctional 4-hydroxy-2-oxoglutarate aldolase/2-dehydro-3-deoxy-phosphogluconate aldolase [Aliiglaciecola sp. LCG003]WJG11095.1 bifunctional 4-hydroxy-2-oxoglutarate aldolase/2-dehydro-3-deoxy-phosphogluconate aldolase [Aliiglaciecola sp. LCG003]
MSSNWKVTSEQVFKQGPVVPVLVIKDVAHAVPLAKALIKGGINVLEVTLRSDAALEAIRKIADEVPEAMIGAGTVTNEEQLKQVVAAGAKFAISPGLTTSLLEAGNRSSVCLIPGISSISELMQGLDLGYTHFKFFPAEASGGIKALKSIGGPFPDVIFCPTGGIGPNNYLDYLALPNVICAGGSWLAPDDAVIAGDWDRITELAKQAVLGAASLEK